MFSLVVGVDVRSPAVERRVKVDPAGEFFDLFCRQTDVVMTLLQYLHQLGLIGMHIHRHQHIQVALDTGAANEPVQVGIGE